jgi:hypothetical protein
MPPINVQMSDGYRGDWLGPVLLVGAVVWLATLWRILHRSDFDPVTRLTWVVVVIFVPVFGMLFYWFSDEKPAPEKRRSILDSHPDLSGTPWEGRPGHTLPKK